MLLLKFETDFPLAFSGFSDDLFGRSGVTRFTFYLFVRYFVAVVVGRTLGGVTLLFTTGFYFTSLNLGEMWFWSIRNELSSFEKLNSRVLFFIGVLVAGLTVFLIVFFGGVGVVYCFNFTGVLWPELTFGNFCFIDCWDLLVREVKGFSCWINYCFNLPYSNSIMALRSDMSNNSFK